LLNRREFSQRKYSNDAHIERLAGLIIVSLTGGILSELNSCCAPPTGLTNVITVLAFVGSLILRFGSSKAGWRLNHRVDLPAINAIEESMARVLTTVPIAMFGSTG
jgi:hypothetical protein